MLAKRHQEVQVFWVLTAWTPCWAPAPSFTIACCLVAQSCLTLRPQRLQHAKLPCPSLSLRVCSNSGQLGRWCHPTISSSVVPFSFCLQFFPASGSPSMSRLFTSRGQSIGASASVLPMSIQDWFPLGLTGLISLLSKGPSRVFSNTTVWKHQFFSTQPSLWSTSHIHTWLLEKPSKWCLFLIHCLGLS